jgi:hypothetical protein
MWIRVVGHQKYATPFLAEIHSSVFKAIPDGEFERMIWACRVFALLSLTDDWIDQQVAVAIRPGVDHKSGENTRGLSDDIVKIIRGGIVGT